MTEEQKQKYIDTMKEKAFAYAENLLSDIKDFLSKNEYKETLKDFAQTFCSGGEAAIETANEFINNNRQKDPPTAYVVTRCEEHSDYVEEVFFDKDKAKEYCDQFKGDENEYARHITKVNITL